MHPVRTVIAAAALAAIVLVGGGAPVARAVLPTTPTVEVWDMSGRSLTLVFYAMPAEVHHVRVACGGIVHTGDPYPYAPKVTVTLDIPGCEGYGQKQVWVSVYDASDVNLLNEMETVWVSPALQLTRPLPAITGHPYTFEPSFPPDYALPAGSHCTWEFRWGNDASLKNDYDETYGSLGHETLSSAGACPSRRRSAASASSARTT